MELKQAIKDQFTIFKIIYVFWWILFFFHRWGVTRRLVFPVGTGILIICFFYGTFLVFEGVKNEVVKSDVFKRANRHKIPPIKVINKENKEFREEIIEYMYNNPKYGPAVIKYTIFKYILPSAFFSGLIMDSLS